MPLHLGHLLPIEHPEQIAEPREADQQLVLEATPRHLTRHQDRRPEPGQMAAPVLDDGIPRIGEPLLQRASPRLVHRVLVATIDADPPQRHPGQIQFSPAHG